ncbi:glycoside hydrolase family 19 protein [Pseudoroseicyclus sp. H15]
MPKHIDAPAIADLFGLAVNDNLRSTALGLEKGGVAAGLDRPHRLVQFLAQLAHESARWRYDREVWGPTSAQKRYETRTDLGNTAAVDGDGFLYLGRTGMQITGRTNYARFTAWVHEVHGADVDFVAQPDLVNTDPWEGLGPIWFWDVGSGESLNRFADAGNTEMVSRRINGGTNGLADRLDLYVQAGLAFLGHGSVPAFQGATGIKVDGVPGPQTRGALHEELFAQPSIAFGKAPTAVLDQNYEHVRKALVDIRTRADEALAV